MVTLWRRNGREKAPEGMAVLAAPVAQKRDQQLNIKVSEDCKLVFAEIQRVQGMKAAALFEDMVAERAERLAAAGLLEL
jgi:hypothetical protein